ncbi:hypothetical protein J2850_002072 [Azospirillum picis]|uniref:Transposase n=1 Tax=Azospirillum picis TaxID=488438 RepID=A0ABU0MHT4_9PROT|nr:hypothetical protein [Azospirillum picis]MDQ0532978.1 hypothetical protein [Azospirillum picis]
MNPLAKSGEWRRLFGVTVRDHFRAAPVLDPPSPSRSLN